MEDQEILTEIFKSLGLNNEIIFFKDGESALEFLDTTTIKLFLILSDVNMPKINGYELKKLIQTNHRLHIKCIPFLFFTTASDKKSVEDAYSLSVQGFFQKPNSIIELESTIKTIIEYWQKCIAPSAFV